MTTTHTHTNTAQGCKKLDIAKQYLDEHCPLDNGSHMQATHYVVYYNHLMAFFADGSHCGLKSPKQFIALSGHKEDPTAILLRKQDGLHVEINFNRKGDIGQIDAAHIDDIQVETPLNLNEGTQSQLQRIWMSFVTGVQHALCNQSSRKQFTAKDGSDYDLCAY